MAEKYRHEVHFNGKIKEEPNRTRSKYSTRQNRMPTIDKNNSTSGNQIEVKSYDHSIILIAHDRKIVRDKIESYDR